MLLLLLQWIDSSWIRGLTDVNFTFRKENILISSSGLEFLLILLCLCVCLQWKCVFLGVFLLYVCMCLKANAWPFSQRINRSSVAAVTAEIRDWLCPCLSHHPPSSVVHVHVCSCVCAGEETSGARAPGYTFVEEPDRRMIKETEER